MFPQLLILIRAVPVMRIIVLPIIIIIIIAIVKIPAIPTTAKRVIVMRTKILIPQQLNRSE